MSLVFVSSNQLKAAQSEAYDAINTIKLLKGAIIL
jgi:hypothetical protein